MSKGNWSGTGWGPRNIDDDPAVQDGRREERIRQAHCNAVAKASDAVEEAAKAKRKIKRLEKRIKRLQTERAEAVEAKGGDAQ